MKKIVLISALMLTIMLSVLAGTLANYTVTLDDLAFGSVVGKEFIFMEDGADTFGENIKIAPTEKVIWQFAVKNYDGSIVTETDLRYYLTFDVKASPGKTAIAPLIITVKNADGEVVDSLTNTGTLSITKDLPLSLTGQRDAYIVEIYWPSTDNDIMYAGNNFGTSIKVSAVAKQIQPGQAPDPEEPGDPEDPTPSTDLSVFFEAGTPWYNYGQPGKYNIRIKITNNSDQTINGWELGFLFDENIEEIWEARHIYENLTTGENKIKFPTWDNKILPGQTVVIKGQVTGEGGKPIRSVTLNGVPAEVQCIYNQGTIW